MVNKKLGNRFLAALCALTVLGTANITTYAQEPAVSPKAYDVQFVEAPIKLNSTSKVLFVGSDFTFKVNGTSKKVTWKSSNAKVATVKNGKVTALKTGTTTIKATVNTKTYTATVKVVKAFSKADFKIKRLAYDSSYVLRISNYNFLTDGIKDGFDTYKDSNSLAYFSVYIKDTGLVSTSRGGLRIASSKSDVIKAYGNTKERTIGSTFDKYLKKAAPAAAGISKIKTYLEYSYKKGENEYIQRFYFDKNGKVLAVVFAKNLGLVPLD
ncbi:Ig-like domain-containing protein [Lachnospiraceae bacterium ZAX-1]